MIMLMVEASIMFCVQHTKSISPAFQPYLEVKLPTVNISICW